MNKYEYDSKPIVISEEYSVKQADDDGKAQLKKGVNFLHEGHLLSGVKCMQEAIRIFRGINEFYESHLNNDNPTMFYELISANQHTSKNNREIDRIEKCFTLLDKSVDNLLYVTDILNGFDLLPNTDQSHHAVWVEKKAGCRFSKCIRCLEKNDLENGIQYAEETKDLFLQVIRIYASMNYPYNLLELNTSYHSRHIKTIETCIQLLKKSPDQLPFVLRVFKGEEKLPQEDKNAQL